MKQSAKLKAAMRKTKSASASKAKPPMPANVVAQPDQAAPAAAGRPRVALSGINVPEKQTNMNALRFGLRLSDAFWIVTMILFAIWQGYIGSRGNDVVAPIAAGVLAMGLFTLGLIISKAHQFAPSETYSEHMKKVGLGAMSAIGAWLTITLIARPETFAPEPLAIAGLLAAGALFGLHTLYFTHISRLHKRGSLVPTIVMLGATESARRIIEANARSHELNILAIFDDRLKRAPHNIHGVPVVGEIKDLVAWDNLPYVDRIVVTLPSMAAARKKDFVEKVRLLPNRIAFVVDEFENLDHVQQRLTQIAEVSMREVTGKPKSGRHTFLKRVMDVGISTVALTIGMPFLLLLGLAIKLESPGPVLFKQKRHGFNNRVFSVYKFRSLKIEDEDKDAASQVTKGDNRVTRIGRIIRKTSLDELPQLWNVIKGDMSLVGPRPHAVGMRTNGKDSLELVEHYAHRHKVKPGMTGWAQINGSRGPLHDQASIARRVQLDVEYIERSSLLFDLKIILKTIPCLLGDKENVR